LSSVMLTPLKGGFSKYTKVKSSSKWASDVIIKSIAELKLEPTFTFLQIS